MPCLRSCTTAPSASRRRWRRSSPSCAAATTGSPWPTPTAAATAPSTRCSTAPGSSASPVTPATTCSASTRCARRSPRSPAPTSSPISWPARSSTPSGARSASTATPSCATTTSTPTGAVSGSHSGRRRRCARPPSTPPGCSACRLSERVVGEGGLERELVRLCQRMKERAEVVVIGAGIVGCAAAHYLTLAGVRDVLVVDQGPIGDTGGSSFHAPGLCFQTNGSKLSCTLAQWTRELYRSLDTPERRTWWEVGSLEVATTPERLTELRRRHAYATSWGLESHVITPDEAIRHIPLLDRELLHGALHVPSDGIARGINICQALQEAAEARGATFVGRTRATGIDMAGGRVRAVETDQGAIRTSTALVCLGLWAPEFMRALGLPLVAMQPMQHLFAWTDPLPELAGASGHRSPHPAPSGSRHVLPPARRGLRHRRLRARADHDRAGRARAAPRRPPDRHRPVLRGALARVARLGARAAAAARAGSASPRRSTGTSRSRSTTTRSPARRRRSRVSGSPTASGSRTPAAPPRRSST